jgi:hypothetical protein
VDIPQSPSAAAPFHLTPAGVAKRGRRAGLGSRWPKGLSNLTGELPRQPCRFEACHPHHRHAPRFLYRAWMALCESPRYSQMPKRQSSSSTSSLAGKVLAGKKPTPSQAKSLAASVLSQDEKKGQPKPNKKG